MAGEMRVELQANLTADPEIVQAGDKTICRLRLAHNTRTKRGQDFVDDAPWFINATLWQAYPQDNYPYNVAQSLSKGDRVDVSGFLKRVPWENDQGKSGIDYQLRVTAIAPSLRFATAQIMRAQNNQQQASPWDAPTGSPTSPIQGQNTQGWTPNPSAPQNTPQTGTQPAAQPAPQQQTTPQPQTQAQQAWTETDFGEQPF